jgi:hypothetical protein
MNFAKPRSREPVVERLVGDGDLVLMVELAQHVREGLDLRAGECGDRREEQTMRRDRPEPFALTGFEAELVDVSDGQRTCERGSHPGQVVGRQRSLLVVERG